LSALITTASNDGGSPGRKRLLYAYCHAVAPTAMLALLSLRYLPCAGGMAINVLARAGTADERKKFRAATFGKRWHVWVV